MGRKKFLIPLRKKNSSSYSLKSDGSAKVK